jgi:hypothetical protein
MRSVAGQKHVVVVPVATFDQPTERALAYARTLAPRVLAVHLRRSSQGPAGPIEAVWARHAASVPLLVLDGTPGEWASCFGRVLDVLCRTEAIDLVTVLVSPDAPDVNPQHGVVPTWAGALERPGVRVRCMPSSHDAGRAET